MAASAGTRLISADDHVDVTQEQVKAFLHPKHHDHYDAAVANGNAARVWNL